MSLIRHSSGHSRHSESDSRHSASDSRHNERDSRHSEKYSHHYERDRPGNDLVVWVPTSHMFSTYNTYQDNLFTSYVGKRVQLIIKNGRSRTHEYIGTLMAVDLDVNVVLADCYRVILNHVEYQRQDVNGLMLVRGSQLLSVKRERDEKRLRRYPTPPFGSKKNAKKDQHRSKSSGSVSPLPAATPAPTPQSTPSRPLKLKRTWKTATPEPTPAFSSKLPRTPQAPVHQDTRVSPAAAPVTISEMVRDLKIKEEPLEEGTLDVTVKQEPTGEQLEDYGMDVPIVKEELVTFEEFLNTSGLKEEPASEGEISD